MELALRTARYCKQNYTGTEHILVGLLKAVHGTASVVLSDAGVELDKLMGLIDRLIAPQGGAAIREPEGYSPRANKVLKDSLTIAEQLGSKSADRKSTRLNSSH